MIDPNALLTDDLVEPVEVINFVHARSPHQMAEESFVRTVLRKSL